MTVDGVEAPPNRVRAEVAAAAEPDAVVTIDRRSRFLLLVAIGLAGLSFAVMQSLVIPVLPLIGTELDASAGAVTWILTGNLLASAIATPIIGRVGDLYGKKWVLVATLGALGIGTVMAALAHTLPVLIVARVIQGVGGGLFPLAFGLIRDRFAADRVPGAIGLISSTLAFGWGLGIVVAGPVVEHFSYQWLFWLPCPLIVLAMVGVALLVPHEPGVSGGRINWSGAVAMSVWMTALLLAMTQGPLLGWTSPWVVGLIVTFVVGFWAWIASERRARVPLVDLAVLVRPAVWRFNLVAFLFGLVLYSTLRIIPELFQAPSEQGYGLGASVTESGLFMLPQTIAAFVVGLMAGPIERVIGSARAVVLGSLFSAFGLAFLAVAHDQVWHALVTSAVLGIGTGLTYAAIPAVIVNAVPRDQTGVATGVNTNVRTVGGAVGSQLTVAILTTGVLFGPTPESRYVWALGILAAISVVAVVIAAGRSGGRRNPVAV